MEIKYFKNHFGKDFLWVLKKPVACLILIVCLILTNNLIGQETNLYQDHFNEYKDGKYFFQERLYGPSKKAMENFLAQPFSPYVEKQKRYILEAKQILVLSSLLLNQPEGEKLVVEFIKTNKPDPIIVEPVLELADFYFNNKKYDKTISYYSNIDNYDLTLDQQIEVNFKKGYSYFVQKEFKEAALSFSKSKSIQSEYYYPTNYYYGMSQYFLKDFDEAVRSFVKVSASKTYINLVPYYITQIYFSQNKFDDLFQYAENIIRQPGVKKLNEIRLLLGQAYFEKQMYPKALPHLEFYNQNTQKLTKEEFFQLGFSQYQLKKFPEAINSFQEIALLDSRLGQLVNYYLADCFIETNDLISSRTAFKKVAQMPFDTKMQEEALFNYGKLSAQLNFDREAINTLIKLESSSPYFEQARKIINDLLVNSGDYVNGIAIIESLDNLSPDLKRTYQLISFNRGKQVLYERKFEGAKYFFSKSKSYPIDPVISTEIDFWEAYILNQNNKFELSNKAFGIYLEKKSIHKDLPIECSPAMAYYAMGYNYMKQNNFQNASKKFKSTADWIVDNKSNISDKRITGQILPDAQLRAGDCFFKLNDYTAALPYYHAASNSSPNYAAYALYQKGLIEGLTNQLFDKILTMDNLVKRFPNNLYADDAYFQMGETHLVLGQIKASIESFNKIITQFKGRSNLVNSTLNKLGLIAYNNGDANSALTYYKSVFKNNPTSSEAQTALIAIEEIYIVDLSDSEGYINFVETVPGYKISDFARDSLNFKIAESKYENGQYPDAITFLNDYLEKNPNGYYKLMARYLKAESYSILKDYPKALDEYLYLTNEGFNDYYLPSVQKAALISYNYSEDYTQAFNLYSEWAEFAIEESDKYEAQVGAMRSAYRIGEFDNSIKYSNRVLKNSIATADDKQQAYYFIGKTSLIQNKNQEALNAFSYIGNGKNNLSAEANYLIARIYYDQNKIDLSEKQINYNTENNTNYPYWIAKSIILYADIYILKDDLFNARAALEAIIENFKDDQILIQEAQKKLDIVISKEEATSRIKTIDTNTLELDTIGGND